jgi:hypothetical protein
MMYIVQWKSKDPIATAKKYVEKGHGIMAGVKVLQDLHVVGSPSGFLLVETDQPELLHKAAAAWGEPTMECSVIPVISGEQAKAAL